MDRATNEFRLEKAELLLIAQHLDRGFTKHGEVQRRPFWGGVGEQNLLRQRGFAGAGAAGQHVEGKLGQATAQHGIEPWHPGAQMS